MNDPLDDRSSASLDERINVRGYFERILMERDRREGERDRRLDERFEGQEKAVTAALAAAEKATNAAFAAAKEAVTKAEEAQLRVNTTQNEFRGTLEDQNQMTERTMMPRAETELLIREMNKKLDDLTGTRRQGIGVSANVAAVVVTIFVSIVSVSAIVAIYFATH
jgi:methylase of polypeptide subunit release factors